MMNTGFGIAGMVSPVVFGYLIGTTGSYTRPFFISAGLLGIGIVAALFIDPSKTVDADEAREAEALNNVNHDLQPGAAPAFASAGGAKVWLERHHLRRPLRWRK
jgi:hypothetical protein